MKTVVWKWEYGSYVPFCPHCGEPAYEPDHCVFCDQSYTWSDGEHKPTEIRKGDYLIVQTTNNHIHLYKSGKRIMHAACDKKLSEEELLQQVDFYEALTSGDDDSKEE